MMFLTSWVGVLLVIACGTVVSNIQLRSDSRSDLMEGNLRTALADPDLLTGIHDSPQAVCQAVLQSIATRVLQVDQGDPGLNGFHRSVADGRVVASTKTSDGRRCTYPATGVSDTLRSAIAVAVDNRHVPNRAVTTADVSDGWIRTITLVAGDNAGAVVSIGFYAISPMNVLFRNPVPWRALVIYLLTMSSLSAIALVLLFVQRIKRAERAATAWTEGQLHVRINDSRQDEFARLAHRFDVMADAMSEVIKVKQALAAAEERNRLARDLHDTAKQRAFAVSLQLAAARHMTNANAETMPLLNASISLTTQLQRDLSDMIRRLSAPTIAESGFRLVLMEGVNALIAGTKTSWTLVMTDHDEKVLNELAEVSRQLFIITIESVSNILRHAGCTRFTICCERDGDIVDWRITDNGNGFNMDHAADRGMGLSNMRLRASGLPGGKFNLVSREGGGTSIAVTFNTATSAQP